MSSEQDRAIARIEEAPQAPAPAQRWTREQIELIKRTIAVGATDDELQLFLMTAARLGLDPFSRQIHFVKRRRWNKERGQYEEIGVIQVGIDGFRAIADRTGCYAPGPEPTFQYKDGRLFSATAYVRKKVGDEWHICAATAHFDEYCPKTKEGEPMGLWATMPHLMLAKCAEALALRRAFPIQLGGLYVPEEMEQANSEAITVEAVPVQPKEEALAKGARRKVNSNDYWTDFWLEMREILGKEATRIVHHEAGTDSIKDWPLEEREKLRERIKAKYGSAKKEAAEA